MAVPVPRAPRPEQEPKLVGRLQALRAGVQAAGERGGSGRLFVGAGVAATLGGLAMLALAVCVCVDPEGWLAQALVDVVFRLR